MGLATTITVVQAGLQIYQALNSRGSGVGDLLSAQIEMLVQIRKYLSVIGQQTEQIYRDVTWIKEKLMTVPSETSRQVYSLGGKATILRTNELVGEYLYDVERFGREKALLEIQDRAERLLSELQQNRSALLSEPQEASIPILISLWDAELMLLLNCVEFDSSRTMFALDSYKTWFVSVFEKKVTPTMDQINLSLEEIVKSQEDAKRKNNTVGLGGFDVSSCQNVREGIPKCNVHWTESTRNVSYIEFNGEIKELIDSRDQMFKDGAPVSQLHLVESRWSSSIVKRKKFLRANKIEALWDGLSNKFASTFTEDGWGKYVNEENSKTESIVDLVETLCLYGNLWLLADNVIDSISDMQKEITDWE